MSKGAGGIVGLQSGRVGGIILKQREGKQLITEFFKPHNPQTDRQMEVRSINTELSRQWRDELNQGQRTAWSQRAEQIPGLRGETLYIRQNFQLLDFGLDKQMSPPPLVMPPELTDLIINPDPPVESLFMELPQLIPGTITAQAPFLDIEIAGGFTVATIEIVAEHFVVDIESQALSQGRVHQNSDFKHVLYAPDQAEGMVPELSTINTAIPGDTTRNIVLRITRFNKFGNASGQRIYNAIVVGPEL